MYEEAKRLTFSNNRLKSENKWLENKLKHLEEKNLNLKAYMKGLKKIYKVSYNCDAKLKVKLLDYESCKIFRTKR